MISLVEITRELWNVHWPKISRAPLLQSWEYGNARCQGHAFKALRFLLQTENGEAVGLMQVLVWSLPLVGGIVRINRGPVFFSGTQATMPFQDLSKAVAVALLETAIRRRWRLLRIVPEFEASNLDAVLALTESGFHKRSTYPVASSFVNISRSPAEIRGGLDGKWRNLLNKSERMGLSLESPPLETALPYMLHTYDAMQKEKKFKGLPLKLVEALTKQDGPLWECRILYATHEGQRHGAIMVVGHGDTCTYLIGWTSQEGRRLQANYFLIWQAMMLYRDMGYRYFDVGGLGNQTTTGVEHFKKGLKGVEYALLGEFSYSRFPLLQ